MADTIESLGLLSQAASFEEESLDQHACPLSAPSPKLLRSKPHGEMPVPEITRVKKSGGGEIKLLKTLITSVCERNCNYCAFRSGRDVKRAALTPDEMARVFYQMYSAGVAEGLFLSSGVVGGGIRTQNRLIDTAEILRKKFHYRGYLHLKIMPGAEKDQIQRAMQLANRVSINLEAPTPERLRALAPLKTFTDELLKPLTQAEQIRASQSACQTIEHRWPSLATQFVVGSVGDTDLELLQISEHLFTKLKLTRIYYSKFTPVHDTPFENRPPETLLRQNRLYQASFLLRSYGYTYEEFDFLQNGNLPLDMDPKLAWAKSHLTASPVEINTANRLQLLRVPGFGPKGVKAILETRKKNPIKEPGDLNRLGINPTRALEFILLDGKRPSSQISLW